MRAVGSRVGGFGPRSARHHSRRRRNRPHGVAPSPSRLLARIPVRPRTTGMARRPAISTPRLRMPGLVATLRREKAMLCIGFHHAWRFLHERRRGISARQLPLALLAANVLLPPTPAGVECWGIVLAGFAAIAYGWRPEPHRNHGFARVLLGPPRFAAPTGVKVAKVGI